MINQIKINILLCCVPQFVNKCVVLLLLVATDLGDILLFLKRGGYYELRELRGSGGATVNTTFKSLHFIKNLFIYFLLSKNIKILLYRSEKRNESQGKALDLSVQDEIADTSGRDEFSQKGGFFLLVVIAK